jgi:PKD repeat protein
MSSSVRLALILLTMALLCHCSDNPTKPNSPPVLAPIGTQRVLEGERLKFVVQAADPEGNVPALSARNIPTHASAVDSGNGRMLFVFEPNFTQSGIYNVTFTASDGQRADSQVVKIMVIDAMNHSPVLAPIGPKSVTEGQTLVFNISASDTDGTIPGLAAIDLPLHATAVDSGNGHLRFVFEPDFSQAGIYNVTFIASDGQLADTEVVTITVIDTRNHSPVLAPIGPKSVLEGQSLAFNISASDSDGTVPVLTALDLPMHAAATDSGNGRMLFAFDPDFNQSGVYNVTLVASDGQLSDSEIVIITVIEAGNQPPVFAPIGPKSVLEGQTLAFDVSATDPEGMTPIMSAFNLPLNAAVTDSGNGRMLFAFDPDYMQSGVYAVTFIASDGIAADSENVSIEVLNVNRPPVLAHIDDAEAYADSSLRLKISATDPDGTMPSLGVINAPENSAMTTSDGTAWFLFTPDSTQIGVHAPIFVATDGELADSQMVKITVSVYEKSVGELWPMAVGNYWVYETGDRFHFYGWTLDSIHVQSSYQSNAVTHWLLSRSIFRYVGNDIAIRNDSMICFRHNVAIPPVWPDRIDTVPAGVFFPTYWHWLRISSSPPESEYLVFAKGVGVTKYEWFNGLAMHPEGFVAFLLRYKVK